MHPSSSAPELGDSQRTGSLARARTRRVTFGFSQTSFYEQNTENQLQGVYSRRPGKRRSLVESNMGTTHEFEDVSDMMHTMGPAGAPGAGPSQSLVQPSHSSSEPPQDRDLTTTPVRSSSLGDSMVTNKLAKHFGVSKNEIVFLKRNQKVLKFFGEAPPPQSYAPQQIRFARQIYDKYLSKNALCPVRIPLQLRDTIRDKIEKELVDSTLYDSAEEEVQSIMHERIVPTYLGADPCDSVAETLEQLELILSNAEKTKEFRQWCNRSEPNVGNTFNFFLAIQKYKIIADTMKLAGDTDKPDAKSAYSVKDTSGEEVVHPRAQIANEIYIMYIRPGAVREIGTSPAVKESTRKRIEEGNISDDMFDEAQKAALNVLRVDLLPKFLEFMPNNSRSDDGTSWTLNHIFGDKHLTKSFLKFCKVTFSEENALFYIAVQQFKSNTQSPFRSIRQKARSASRAELHDDVKNKLVLNMHRRRPSYSGLLHYQQRVSDADLNDMNSPDMELPRASVSATSDESKITRSDSNNSISGKTRSRVLKAHRLLNEYIKPGAVKELSLPPAVRKQIKRDVENGAVRPQTFDSAQKETLHKLFVDFYPQYQAAQPVAKKKWSILGQKKKEAKMEELVALLEDKEKGKDFVKFMKGLHCEELITFYHDVEKFKNTSIDDAMGSDEAVTSSDDDDDDMKEFNKTFANSPIHSTSHASAAAGVDSRDADATRNTRAQSNVSTSSESIRVKRYDFLGRPSISRTGSADDSLIPGKDSDNDYSSMSARIRESRAQAATGQEAVLAPSKDAESKNLGKTMEVTAGDGSGGMRRIRSILKGLDEKAMQMEQDMRRVRRARDLRIQQCIASVKRGAILTKYDARRRPIQRFFSVSKDGSEVRWGKPGGTPNRKRQLADVVAMHYGPFSSRFKYFDCSVGKAWMCIVVEFEDRTLDIVCENSQQLTEWFLGLQSLAPLNVTQLTMGGLLWGRANMIVDRRAFFSRSSPQAVWARLLLDARLAQKNGKLEPATQERADTMNLSPRRKMSVSDSRGSASGDYTLSNSVTQSEESQLNDIHLEDTTETHSMEDRDQSPAASDAANAEDKAADESSGRRAKTSGSKTAGSGASKGKKPPSAPAGGKGSTKVPTKSPKKGTAPGSTRVKAKAK